MRIFFTIILIFLIMFFSVIYFTLQFDIAYFRHLSFIFSTEFNRLYIFFIFSSYVEKIMAAMTKILTNSSTQIIPKLVPFKNEPSTHNLSHFVLISHLLFLIHCFLFTFSCLLFLIYCFLYTVSYLLFLVYCFLFTFFYLLFLIFQTTLYFRNFDLF